MNNHDQIADYYDIIQETICDYEAESLGLHRVFQESNVNECIDVCCGTGSHLLHLSRLGYTCTGCDISGEMLRAARGKLWNIPVKLLHVDMMDLELEGAFDAVLCLYALSLLPVESVDAVMDKWYRLLRPGGTAVINAMNADFIPGGKGGPPVMINTGEKGNIKAVRLNTMKQNGDSQDWQAVWLVEDNGKVSLRMQDNKLHLYRLSHLESTLRRHGFRVRNVYGDIAGLKPFSTHSHDIVVVASRDTNTNT